MALIKIAPGTKVSLQGKTIFSSSLGGGEPTLTDTVVYDSSGNVLYTNTGDVPGGWIQGQNIVGYVDIGTSATSIGVNAFSVNNLTAVNFDQPSSVTSIGSNSFYANNFSSVTIPDSVTSVGSYAFYVCDNLATVNCYAPQTAFNGSSNVFYNNNFALPLTIHVKSTDNTWTEQTNAPFQGKSDVTIIKDL